MPIYRFKVLTLLFSPLENMWVFILKKNKKQNMTNSNIKIVNIVLPTHDLTFL